MQSGSVDSSQPIKLRTLRGTQPGLLDPSQPSRLLRFPDSKLFFSSFDPKTALVDFPDNRKRTTENLTPPKRIVIETTSKGASFWRFVPRARLEEGAQDEGVWPRVVDICGETVHCFQEQWEIYKLDPVYQCVVYPWPKFCTITKFERQSQSFETVDPVANKRTRKVSPETSQSSPHKRARSHYADGEEEEFGFTSEEDGVEEMLVDESSMFRAPKPSSDRKSDRTSREKVTKARLERWAKNRKAHEQPCQAAPATTDSFSMRVDSEDDSPSRPTTLPAESNVKRKGNGHLGSDSDDEVPPVRSIRTDVHGYKRARTTSPSASVNAQQEKRRSERMRPYDHRNREARRKKFVETLGFAFVPPESIHEIDQDETEFKAPEADSQEPDCPGEIPLDPEAAREVEIAESIRRLRELERDRPLWEEQRKKREAREHGEEQERLAQLERRRQAEELRKRQEREAAEREIRRTQEEAEKRALEEELRQREIRQRRRRQRWESGPWTTHRALERYRMLSEEFDATKFTSDQPITFQDIPWPVLHLPSRLTVEDVDWSAVETFFATVQTHMRPQDYKDFVEKSHRRFHPDRWRARKVWTAVRNEVERGCLEVAANTVAQAITPIWRAVKEH
ncbi:hypothetical protein PAXRUDRAFT_132332 [Paxillus rubicundulus Ve08.2h10]|uniref:Uncharacterized protein n=1 Tax=Paxillus rubicundulus Ve08.2h10 TaxID=930991 RepID=A0A0D0DL55_9AGAM|nr:hypothetical protein PAXRUDRAFT_132332 [Paxillus rubicundulus Ve08.2h10]